MRRCPVCKLAYRGADPGAHAFVPPGNAHGAAPGTYSCCSECAACYADGYAGTATLVGAGQTTAPGPAALCGVCRLYLREDDDPEALRLWRADLDDAEAARLIPPQDQHACYAACGACRRKYAPAVFARLKRQGLVPEGMKPALLAPQQFA